MLSKEMRNMDITAFLNAEINTDVLPDYTRFDRSKLFFIESEKKWRFTFSSKSSELRFLSTTKKKLLTYFVCDGI